MFTLVTRQNRSKRSMTGLILLRFYVVLHLTHVGKLHIGDKKVDFQSLFWGQEFCEAKRNSAKITMGQT
jgi:hypothetical protein